MSRDFIDSTSSDEDLSARDASNIYENIIDQAQTKKALKATEIDDKISEVSEERLAEIERKIKSWHDTTEYKKLCEKVRTSVEEKLRE